jgi:ribosomal protein S18 acetylase RimI-like enzyme
MPATPLHIRRCRRTDFIDVMRLLGDDDAPAAVPEKRTLRRFRGIVNDLGVDLYLAFLDGALAGLVHVTYARQLADGPRAEIARLVVARSLRRQGIGSALVDFARQRAIRRGCVMLSCSVPEGNDEASAFLEKAGLSPDGAIFTQELKS